MLAAFASCDSCQCCYLLTSTGAMKLKVEWSRPLQRKPQHVGVHKRGSLQACKQGSCGCYMFPGIHRMVLPWELPQHVLLVFLQSAGLHCVLFRCYQVTAGWSHLLPSQTRFLHVIIWCYQITAGWSDQLLAMPPLQHLVIWSHNITTTMGRHWCVRCHGSFCSASAWSIQPGQC